MTIAENTWEQPAEAPAKKPFYKRWWFVIPITSIATLVVFIGIILAVPSTSNEPTREQLFEAGKQACYSGLMERMAESKNRAAGWEGKHGAYIDQGATSGYMEFEIEVLTSRLLPWKQTFHCEFDASTLPATVTNLTTSDPE